MPVHFVHRFVLPAALLSLLLIGCATSPGGGLLHMSQQGATPGTGPTAPVDSKETVVYLVPKSTDIIHGRRPEDIGIEFPDALKGIGFESKTLSRNAKDAGQTWGNVTTESLNCAKVDVARNMLLCTKGRELVLNSSGRARWYAYNMFYIAISVDEKPDVYVVTLLPTIKEAKSDRSLSNSVNAPAFPESEILDVLGRGCFRFKFEVDSQYDKDSVLANFVRLLGTPGGVRSLKKTDAKSFKLKGDGYDAELVVEFWPYRGGSKSTVTAVVTSQPTSIEPGISRTIDVQRVMDVVKKEVEKIVKS